MARVIVTIDLMPEDPAINLTILQKSAEEKIKNFGGDIGRTSIEPIAFGLKMLKIMFIMDENKGSTEPLEKSLSEIQGVKSVNVSDVRRTIG